MNGEYCVSILLLCTAQSLKDKFCLQRQIKPSQLVLDSYSRSQETLKGNREKGAEKINSWEYDRGSGSRGNTFVGSLNYLNTHFRQSYMFHPLSLR